MVSKHNQSNLKNKIILFISIVLFIIGYVFINRLIDQDDIQENTEIVITDNKVVEIDRIASLSKNSAICNAFAEIYNGYLNLQEKNTHSAGFSSNFIQELYISPAHNKIRNKEKYGCPYSYAIYKYHPFFSAYAKSLNLNNLYFIEPQNNTILYSNIHNKQLLKVHSSSEFNDFINKVKSMYYKKDIFQTTLKETNEILIGSPVYYNNQLLGVVVATIKL